MLLLISQNEETLECFPRSRFDFRFRDAIARRFGFLPCSRNEMLGRPAMASAAATASGAAVAAAADGSSGGGSSLSWSVDNQYVHYTGNMFLLIPTAEIRLQTGIQGVKEGAAAAAQSAEEEEAGGDGGLMITRSLSDKKPLYDHSKTGFLWSWNFMISRKWKQISNTGERQRMCFLAWIGCQVEIL